MGRRMKTSEIFNGRPLLAGFGGWQNADRGLIAAALHLHTAAGREPELAFGDHGFARLQPAVDHQFLIDCACR